MSKTNKNKSLPPPDTTPKPKPPPTPDHVEKDGEGPWKKLLNENDGTTATKTPEDLKNFIKQPFHPRSAERLDEDFFNYAIEAHGILVNSQLSSKQYDLANRWMYKLLTETYTDIESKKNRNIFLSNLLLQVADGALVSPLLKLPPSGPLPNASVAFQLSTSPDSKRLDKTSDNMLDPKDYMHQSTDGRTYIATKALEGDVGACAFIGISVGGGEPVWIKPSGEETNVPEREDLMVSHVEARGDNAIFRDVKPANSPSVILGRRKSQFERKGLCEFYQTVLAKIEEAKNDRNLKFDGPKDQLLRKLVQKIRCEMKAKGATDEECKYELLMQALERKIRCLIQSALERDEEIKRIAADANVVDNDPKLVDLSAMMAFDPEDDIWKAAVSGEPGSEVLKKLNKNYPSCVVKSLLMLLERQRQITIDQEKKAHEQLVAAMKTELLANVKDGVVQFKVAERYYNKVMKALKQAEKLLHEKAAEGPSPEDASDSAANSKVASINNQVLNAQRKLDAARQTALDIDNKTDELTCQIADVQRRNKEASEMLRQDAMRWSKIICQMKADLKAQLVEIQRLDKIMTGYQTNEHEQYNC